MNIDEYFLRSRDKMASKQDHNSAEDSELGATASMTVSPPAEEERQTPREDARDVVLDAAFRQAIQEITANITKLGCSQVQDLCGNGNMLGGSKIFSAEKS
ncbi:hypothetical protein D5F01_LYC24000 [Xyrichtys novacula]|uniref:Uncharacterized protein n=1 Tax=Xyrichtys novacula TaxID=13765 RepID=A0AAV1GSE2_XYRNO|nr:hypothetical protein D5F01_LYC24000 [Xyrichtys novacula]